MKNILLATVLLFSTIDIKSSDRSLWASFMSYGVFTAAALKLGYAYLPSMSKVNQIVSTGFHATSILNQVKPNWFPGRQQGLKNPEETRVNPGNHIEFDPIFFTQWNEINDIIQSITIIQPNTREQNILSADCARNVLQMNKDATTNLIEKNGAGTVEMLNHSFMQKLIQYFVGTPKKAVSSDTKQYKPKLEHGKYAYLLQGPPGCGKTSLPLYLAQKLNCPLYHINAASLSTGYSGSTVANFKNIIEAAYKAARQVNNKTAIVFIDDIDTMFQASSEEISLLQGYILDMVEKMQDKSQYIQNKEKAEVLLFCTANYNQSKWLEQGALHRTGRAQLIDYKTMYISSNQRKELLIQKINAAKKSDLLTHITETQISGVSQKLQDILSINIICIGKKSLCNLLNIKASDINQHYIQTYGSFEEALKKIFNNKYSHLKVLSIKKNDSQDQSEEIQNVTVYKLTFDKKQFLKASDFLSLNELVILLYSLSNKNNDTFKTYGLLFENLNKKQIEPTVPEI